MPFCLCFAIASVLTYRKGAIKRMRKTMFSSPKSLAAAALIIFSLLLIAAEPANAVPRKHRKPKPAGIFVLADKFINGNGFPLIPIRPLVPPPPPPPRKPIVDTEKNATTTGDLMKEEFLAAHNEARAAVGHSPLRWNDTLAAISKRWALNRIHDCKMIHSPESHHVHGHGENLFWGRYEHWSPKKVVKHWFDERAHYDPKTNTCLQPIDPKQGKHECGHYTQIIWKDTVEVGCARVTCLTKKGGWFYMCAYSPPGNVGNEDPFHHWVN